MSLTKAARSELNTRIIPHAGMENAERTKTGLLKSGKGLIIPPSTLGSRDLQMAELTPDERAAYGTDDPASIWNKKDAADDMAAAKPASRKRRTSRQVTEDKPVEKHSVRINVKTESVGFSTEYHHVYKGPNALVLGLLPEKDVSYMPKQSEVTSDGPTNIVEFGGCEGRYVNLGWYVVDDDGITNIMMIRLKEQ